MHDTKVRAGWHEATRQDAAFDMQTAQQAAGSSCELPSNAESDTDGLLLLLRCQKCWKDRHKHACCELAAISTHDKGRCVHNKPAEQSTLRKQQNRGCSRIGGVESVYTEQGAGGISQVCRAVEGDH